MDTSFKGVYSRNNLSKIKDGPYTINLNEYELEFNMFQEKLKNSQEIKI